MAEGVAWKFIPLLEDALRRQLEAVRVPLRSELDEQGLQVAALSHDYPPYVVSVDEVSICSPSCPTESSSGLAVLTSWD